MGSELLTTGYIYFAKSPLSFSGQSVCWAYGPVSENILCLWQGHLFCLLVSSKHLEEYLVQDRYSTYLVNEWMNLKQKMPSGKSSPQDGAATKLQKSKTFQLSSFVWRLPCSCWAPWVCSVYWPMPSCSTLVFRQSVDSTDAMPPSESA